MKSKVTTAPASEPVSLADLKVSLRITNTAEDTLLAQYITDAREIVERYTSRKLITQTLTGYASSCHGESGEWWEGYRMGHSRILSGVMEHIELDNGPVQSITSVATVDTDNTESAYASTNYYLDNYDDDMMPRIVFNDDADAPTSLRLRDSWKVVYVAGYGDNASDVPADIRRALTMLAGYLWANRGACGGDKDCVSGCGAMSMLDRYRINYALS